MRVIDIAESRHGHRREGYALDGILEQERGLCAKAWQFQTIPSL